MGYSLMMTYSKRAISWLWLPAATSLVLAIGCQPRPSEPREEQESQATFNSTLDDLGHRAFRWFQKNHHPQTGMVLDRGPTEPGKGSPLSMASIAAVGYYLSLLPEAVRIGELTDEQAKAEAMRILRFATDRLDRHDGLFYHFVDWETGKRWRESEISLLDSAIFFNGCIVIAEAFGAPVARLANDLVDQADWPKFIIQDPKTNKTLLSLGWTPEKGLLSPADVRSSEFGMAYFLAVGSQTHPIDAQLWYNTEVKYRTIADFKVLNGEHPLFTSYYGLGWHDLRDLADRHGVNLYDNARKAALANRAFCRGMADRHRTFLESEGGWWGLSAGDAPQGYVAQGPVVEDVDGTVWPVAALAALPWMVEEMRADLSHWRSSPVWPRVNGEGGLASFNLDKNWFCPDLLGIDLGSFYLSLANYRNETVWKLWMRHPVGQGALNKLQFHGVKQENKAA
jgi:hypothetical protein